MRLLSSLRHALSEKVARPLCNLLSSFLGPPRVIYDRHGDSPYLTRYYFFGRRGDDESRGSKTPSWPGLPVNLYLHHFHRGDDDTALHSHPWSWSLAFVLVGGYSEERRVGDRVIRRHLLPFSLNVIHSDDYHRVDLYGRDAWTLFVAGPRVDTWYFWDRFSLLRMRWDLYIKMLRTGHVEAGAWEWDSRETCLNENLRETSRRWWQ